MADLMEEVLVLGMVEAGKLDFRPTALDFAGFCRRLVDELQSATNNKCLVQIAMPEDARYVLDRCAIEGFYGASSMERLPTELAITAQVKAFMDLRLK